MPSTEKKYWWCKIHARRVLEEFQCMACLFEARELERQTGHKTCYTFYQEIIHPSQGDIARMLALGVTI